MGIVQDLYAELKNYIRITATCSDYIGSDINPGDTFNMYVKISNIAPVTVPGIAFEIGCCFVHATDYAVPLNNNGNEMSYNQAFFEWPGVQHVLTPDGLSEITSLPVRMKAKATGPEVMPTPSGNTVPFVENIAKICLDNVEWLPDRRFTIETTVRKNIKAGYS